MGEFRATTFDELFDQTQALPWEIGLPANARFPVVGKSVKSTLYSISDCLGHVKKVVVESLKGGITRSGSQRMGFCTRLKVALLKDIVTLTIDTTGPGLHKRGYRPSSVRHPSKRLLAAAMIIPLPTGITDTALIDPFCWLRDYPHRSSHHGTEHCPESQPLLYQ